MNNFLIIGNGFDLYHGLPTRYTDFLKFTKYWEMFYTKYKLHRLIDIGIIKEPFSVKLGKKGEIIEDSIEDFYQHAYCYNDGNIKYLNNNLIHNTWIKYFERTEYKKEGWIDFEKEIERVLFIVDDYYENELPQLNKKIPLNVISNDKKVILELFQPNGSNILNQKVQHTTNYSLNRQKQKHLILEFMKSQLDNLIECFRLYLLEFVSNIKIDVFSPQIDKLHSFKLLSFNYTSTFNVIYKEKIQDIHQIHGSIENKNLIMGIRDDFTRSLDYIYFQKYFQRIQKRTGDYYKEWFNYDEEVKSEQELEYNYPSVFIMGHSLDKTDKEILKLFIDAEYTVTIFFHNQLAYEQQVINLIDMFGKEKIINKVSKRKIIFEELQPPKFLHQRERKDLSNINISELI